MNRTFYYHLFSPTMNPCFETKETYAKAIGKSICPACGFAKQEPASMDVWLQERAPRDKPMNFVCGSCIGLVHRELLELIGDDLVQRDLVLGRVTGDGGRKITDWVTFRGHHRVIVRGSKDAEYRTCDGCGRNLYYAGGKRYLYPAPSSEATIYESDSSGLVVPPDVYERVTSRSWRRLGVNKLEVLDRPIDQLGEIPLFAERS